ncbi:MAG: hypothetical protein JKY02_04420 [Flavobacteriaceae bacterium]|nr:hypothetical protein [Flavobacteriaceae bacterium]
MKTLKLILLVLLLSLSFTSCTDEIIEEEFRKDPIENTIPIDSVKTFTGEGGTGNTGSGGKGG